MSINEFPEETTPAPTPQPLASSSPATSRPDVAPVQAITEAIKAALGQVVIGQQAFIDLLLAALLADGHVLIEGAPGIAKTLTAKLLAQSVEASFSRIQFTPDLMPSDVLGTTVFNPKLAEFAFHPGPIFANMVLIDEINRAPAKTQAALFEVMEEQQVTFDGVTYPLDAPFFVMATQNPIEQEGTYKLPEGQLDRFLFKLKIGYPSLEEEQQILRRFRREWRVDVKKTLTALVSPAQLADLRNRVEAVHVEDVLLDYIAALVHQTRSHPDLFLGASPRASLAILRGSKAIAAMSGRDFVTPEDVQYVADPVLNHRLILQPEREMEGRETTEVIRGILQSLEVPR